MDVDESLNEADVIFKCNGCSKSFETKDLLMKHKKVTHVENVKHCKNFNEGNCRRKDQDCWFKHAQNDAKSKKEESQSSPISEKYKRQDFHQTQFHTVPPDHMAKELFQMVQSMSQQIKMMESKIHHVMNLKK